MNFVSLSIYHQQVATAIDSKADLVKLFFKGSPLENDRERMSLAALSIGPRAVVHMVLKPSRKHAWVPLSKKQKNDKKNQEAGEGAIDEGDEEEEEENGGAEETEEEEEEELGAEEVEDETSPTQTLSLFCKTQKFAQVCLVSIVSLSVC